MRFLLTVRMPQNEILEQMPAVWQARLFALEVQYKVVGRINGNRKIANAIVNNLFVGPDDTRVDEDGVLLERTEMPPSWTLLSQDRIERGSDLMKAIAGTPVTIDAGTIMDADIEHSQRYARYYVQHVFDDTDPDNPVSVGVILIDRIGNQIVQSVDTADPDNPVSVYLIPGAAPASDGSYTKTWTTPGKAVPGVGTVELGALEPNGDYIHTPYTHQVDKPALVTMTAIGDVDVDDEQSYIGYMNDIVETDGDGNETSRTRPTQAAEISLFAGYRRAYL